jgi:integrase/recombinase XerD
MTTFSGSDQVVVVSDSRLLRAAVAAYLGRYRGESPVHTGSDLKVFLTWCADGGLDPLSVGRVEIERYVRWLQEVRCYQPSTVSRRLSVVPVSTGSASSTRSWRTHRPTTSADHPCPPSHPPSDSGTTVRGPAHHRPAVDQRQ